VRDNGAGMTAAQLARAFEPFVEADPTISSRFGGTGIGLAMTRKLMDLLGGEIEATSTLGGGSCFVLTAPAIIEETRRQADEKQISTAA
jgi:signal transduction histidine kinase